MGSVFMPRAIPDCVILEISRDLLLMEILDLSIQTTGGAHLNAVSELLHVHTINTCILYYTDTSGWMEGSTAHTHTHTHTHTCTHIQYNTCSIYM